MKSNIKSLNEYSNEIDSVLQKYKNSFSQFEEEKGSKEHKEKFQEEFLKMKKMYLTLKTEHDLLKLTNAKTESKFSEVSEAYINLQKDLDEFKSKLKEIQDLDALNKAQKEELASVQIENQKIEIENQKSLISKLLAENEQIKETLTSQNEVINSLGEFFLQKEKLLSEFGKEVSLVKNPSIDDAFNTIDHFINQVIMDNKKLIAENEHMKSIICDAVNKNKETNVVIEQYEKINQELKSQNELLTHSNEALRTENENFSKKETDSFKEKFDRKKGFSELCFDDCGSFNVNAVAEKKKKKLKETIPIEKVKKQGVREKKKYRGQSQGSLERRREEDASSGKYRVKNENVVYYNRNTDDGNGYNENDNPSGILCYQCQQEKMMEEDPIVGLRNKIQRLEEMFKYTDSSVSATERNEDAEYN